MCYALSEIISEGEIMKIFRNTILALALTTTLIQPKAEALATFMAVTVGGATAWLYVPALAVSVPMGYLGVKTLMNDVVSELETLGSISFLALGIVILDEKNPGNLSFSQLDSKAAHELGISNTMAKKYNLKLGVINQITKSLQKSCIKKLKDSQPNGEFTDAPSDEDLDFANRCFEKGWKAYQKANANLIDADVYTVVQSIRHQELK